MTDKLEIIKAAAVLTVGAGTTKIVNQTIQNNVEPKNVADKVSITAASVVIGMIVADKTSAYTARTIDNIAHQISAIKRLTQNRN